MTEAGSRYNLLREPWLPVVRESGATEWILPSGVNDGIDSDPIVGFAWPRPDFNGAAHEFLIGLLSTTTSPADEDEWEDWWLTPPPPGVLQQRFDEVAHAFDLDGPGARFLQDLDPLEHAESKQIAQLLIDAPGAQTLRHNADLFVKRDTSAVLGRASAAMALYTLSAYAPSGGAGHRTSIRGGGPMATLIVADGPNRRRTLWDRLWPNVETAEQIERRAPQLTSRDATAIFPWLAPTRTSNKKENGRLTTPSDVHPLQVYWGMPRRIRLVFEDAQDRHCSLTDSKDRIVASIYRTKNYGIDYSEGFEHPLTPYYRRKPGTAKLPRHAQSVSVTYRLWPSITCREHLSAPAQVVLRWKERRPENSGEVRVATFGYDMDNMKARAWVEGEVPLYLLDDAHLQEHLERFITKAVAAAATSAQLLTKSVKGAFRDKPKDARGDFGFLAERFYRETETQFHMSIERATQSIQTQRNEDDPTIHARERWIKETAPVAMRLFDEYAPADGLQDRDMERHVRARHYLALALSGRGRDGKRLFGELGVGPPQNRDAKSIATGTGR